MSCLIIMPFFKFLSRAHLDYSPSAEFLVYTTTGYLQLASRTTDVFTTPYGDFDATSVSTAANSIADLKSYYNNIVYTYKTNPTSPTDLANVDCETASSTAMQCIEKGDYVICAVSKKIISLENLNYWNVDLQESYYSPVEAKQRFDQLKKD